jgi:ABC-2 type transport system permease protein
LALGLVISSVIQTQNQAQQLGSMTNIAAMFLGGVLFPAYALPFVLRVLGYAFPSTFFVPLARGMFLKGVGLDVLWPEALGLVVLLALSLVLAAQFFRQSLE